MQPNLDNVVFLTTAKRIYSIIRGERLLHHLILLLKPKFTSKPNQNPRLRVTNENHSRWHQAYHFFLFSIRNVFQIRVLAI